MAHSNAAPGARLLATWRRLSPLPGGKRLFSWYVGRMAPYTGSVGAVFVELRPGHARAELRDRRRVRNHLHSVHAVALVNLAEVTSGLAMLSALPPGVRGIVTALEIEYLKKARGRLIATTDTVVPEMTETCEHRVTAEIRDAAGDSVARAAVTWRLSPPEAAAASPAASDEAA
jgi:acyl-coenzyme A thioesterase PaaI-like protein